MSTIVGIEGGDGWYEVEGGCLVCDNGRLFLDWRGLLTVFLFSHGLLCKTGVVPPLDRYWFICIFIYLFSALTFFSKHYSSHSSWPILMKFGMNIVLMLRYSKTANMCLYCLYKQSYRGFSIFHTNVFNWTLARACADNVIITS